MAARRADLFSPNGDGIPPGGGDVGGPGRHALTLTKKPRREQLLGARSKTKTEALRRVVLAAAAKQAKGRKTEQHQGAWLWDSFKAQEIVAPI